MILDDFKDKKIIHPPDFVVKNCIYLTTMGSFAYGVNTAESDNDIYGICIPDKEVIFPHLNGEILGFDVNGKRFEQWQEGHIINPDDKKEYDFAIYNIVKYFRLCADGNPNMLDSIFTSDTCVRYMNSVGKLIRDNRKLFLSKKISHTFKGYAYSQLSKIGKTAKAGRRDLVKEYGYDTKYAYHLVRLLLECEQILIEGDLDLLRNQPQLRSIRSGEWSLYDIKEFFTTKQKTLDDLYINSNTIPHKIREKEIKQLLLDCLELHFGSLSNIVVNNGDKHLAVLKNIKNLIDGVI